MKTDLIKKIKSHGYWRINFKPVVYEDKIKSLEDCKLIVEKNLVRFRGWNYPHFPSKSKENAAIEIGNNYYMGWIDWDYNKEFWYMYQSGQFLHYRALKEDWYDESDFVDDADKKKFKPQDLLIITTTIFQLTEIYEFLSRLTRAGIYDEGVIVDISLNNTLNRVLYLNDSSRIPLDEEYKTTMNNIEFKKKYDKKQVLSIPNRLALETVCYFFERFGWHSPPMQTFINDQENLLNR
jgi:hypothetical protein